IHPLVIMLTVPLGVLGALIGRAISGGTLNLFSQIGIVMLVGLAAKNGILIVEFANQLRDAGRSVRDAIVEASAVRLRPILMTSLAFALGVVPLMLASGASAETQHAIGTGVFGGMVRGTVLAIFFVPAFFVCVVGLQERVARWRARRGGGASAEN
ncbi:efflux RND transporter permease subunit, partial [Brevibacillus sp. SKDU10]|uniref:efflux RND transporter permease subunit n=1 Tax=Brevibacillus sp. SKDU10 TaxID=1247872 RepID=UPI000A5ED9F7